jgi:hypothetical protein
MLTFFLPLASDRLGTLTSNHFLAYSADQVGHRLIKEVLRLSLDAIKEIRISAFIDIAT